MPNDLFDQVGRDNEHNYNDIIKDNKTGVEIKALFVSHVGKNKMMFFCNSSLVMTDNDKNIVDYLGVSAFMYKHM